MSLIEAARKERTMHDRGMQIGYARATVPPAHGYPGLDATATEPQAIPALGALANDLDSLVTRLHVAAEHLEAFLGRVNGDGGLVPGDKPAAPHAGVLGLIAERMESARVLVERLHEGLGRLERIG